jgi:hypothetical protein
MIQDDGMVSTGAGTHSPHPLQVTAKSQKRAGSPTNMRPSIGEEKANCLAPVPKCFLGLARKTAVPGLPSWPHPNSASLSISSRTWKSGDFSDAPALAEWLGANREEHPDRDHRLLRRFRGSISRIGRIRFRLSDLPCITD